LNSRKLLGHFSYGLRMRLVFLHVRRSGTSKLCFAFFPSSWWLLHSALLLLHHCEICDLFTACNLCQLSLVSDGEWVMTALVSSAHWHEGRFSTACSMEWQCLNHPSPHDGHAIETLGIDAGINFCPVTVPDSAACCLKFWS